MKLTDTQVRALRKANEYPSVILGGWKHSRIPANTARALKYRGLLEWTKHPSSFVTAYRITEKGKQWLRDNETT